MSQQNDTGILSITAGAARSAFLRVYNSSGTWTTAGASNGSDGVQQQPSLAATDIVPVKAGTAPGTTKMTAAGAISAGATVYAAASGKIASSGTIIEGKALEAATADGDIIEVLPLHNSDISTATSGTTAAAFEVDSDANTPKIALSGQSGGAGDYTTTLKPETTLSADNAIIVPEADGDTLVAAALAQTLTNKTLTSPSMLNSLTLEVGTVAAAGSAQGDAGAIDDTAIVWAVTAGDDTKGVVLPTAVAGNVKVILNSGTAGLKIYPASSDKINNGSADAAITILENTMAILIATAADNWAAVYTVNS